MLTVAMVGGRWQVGSKEALLPRLASSGLEKGHRQPMPMSREALQDRAREKGRPVRGGGDCGDA